MYRRRISQILTVIVGIGMLWGTPAYAAPYGGGSYGECSYQTDCTTTSTAKPRSTGGAGEETTATESSPESSSGSPSTTGPSGQTRRPTQTATVSPKASNWRHWGLYVGLPFGLAIFLLLLARRFRRDRNPPIQF